MSKRFTSSEKFYDPWYRKLTPVQKCLWEYALCQCDYAGFWNVDLESAAFHIGVSEITQEDLKAFDKRFVWISEEMIFIPKFVSFQYGTLDPTNKAHQGVIKLLEKNNVSSDGVYMGDGRGYVAPTEGLCSPYVAPTKEKEKERNPLNNPPRNKNKIIYPPWVVPPREVSPSKKAVQNGCRFENSEFFSEDLPEAFANEASKLSVREGKAEQEFAKFRDYWLAKSGADATKRDWLATWRNWLRRIDGGQGQPPSPSGVSPTREEMEAFLGRKMQFESEVGNEFAV